MTKIAKGEPKWGRSKAPILAAMIWTVSGGCSFKVRSQTIFKEHRTRKSTANTEENFDERGIAIQKRSCLHLGDLEEEAEQNSEEEETVKIPLGASMPGRESKPRGQPSLITTTIFYRNHRLR